MWLTAWRTIVQIFYICIVLLVFANLQGRMETIVVALFGLTYVTIRTGVIGNAMMLRAITMGLQQEIDAIKASVIPDFVVPESNTELRETVAKANRPFWFEYAGLSVVSLTCLYKLFNALA